MWKRALFSVLVGSGLALSAGGCGNNPDVPLEADEPEESLDGKADAWNAANNPAAVDRTFILDVANLPVKGESATPPIPADYWPTHKDSLNYRWNGDDLSPAEKVEKAFGLADWTRYISANFGIKSQTFYPCASTSDCAKHDDDGSECVRPRGTPASVEGSCVPTWWGICHGWAPYAFSEPDAKQPVVKNGVTFYPGDLNGLMSLMYSEGLATRRLSSRCNTEDPTVDANGRVIDSACRDMNAGAWHVLVTNKLGLQQQSFVYDRTYDLEVWNQPVRGFAITNLEGGKLRSIAKADARAKVSPAYNPDADELYYVEMDFDYITEAPADRTSNVPDVDLFTVTERFAYVLEVKAGKIVGGEWAGSSRTLHPDFAWWPAQKPTTNKIYGLSYQEVKALNDEAAGLDGAARITKETTIADDSVRWISAYYTPSFAAGDKVELVITSERPVGLYARIGSKPTLTNAGRAKNLCNEQGAGTQVCKFEVPPTGASYFVRVKPIDVGRRADFKLVAFVTK